MSPSPRSPKNRATATNTAKLMGISRMAVIKIAKAYFSGGEKAVQALSWGKGRRLQNCFFTQAEIDHLVSRNTLAQQVGWSLPARALHFSKNLGKSISAYQLRGFYYGRGITI